jgi:hypothetical protein
VGCITDVQYRTSVPGIEHQLTSPFDERIDNTLLLSLKSGTGIAHCLQQLEAPNEAITRHEICTQAVA